MTMRKTAASTDQAGNAGGIKMKPVGNVAGAKVEAKGSAVEAEAGVKEGARFTVKKLRDKSICLFGVSQSTFDGAMHDQGNEKFTVDEARAIVDQWLYGKKGGNI